MNEQMHKSTVFWHIFASEFGRFLRQCTAMIIMGENKVEEGMILMEVRIEGGGGDGGSRGEGMGRWGK